MTVRLTAETLTDENLATAAVESAGLLGIYKRNEFDAMMQKPLEHWSFDWLESKLDTNVGRVKMRPLTQEAVMLLDRGRAFRIIERHRWMSLPRAIGFIKAVKGHRLGMNVTVQDALIHTWEHKGREDALASVDEFHRWIKKAVKATMAPDERPAGLRPEHRQAAFDLMPKVVRVMNKSFSERSHRRHRRSAKATS